MGVFARNGAALLFRIADSHKCSIIFRKAKKCNHSYASRPFLDTHDSYPSIIQLIIYSVL